MTVQAYMVVLCATWRKARGVYDLLCEMVRHHLAIKPLLMYGASGDHDIEVRIIFVIVNLGLSPLESDASLIIWFHLVLTCAEQSNSYRLALD